MSKKMVLQMVLALVLAGFFVGCPPAVKPPVDEGQDGGSITVPVVPEISTDNTGSVLVAGNLFEGMTQKALSAPAAGVAEVRCLYEAEYVMVTLKGDSYSWEPIRVEVDDAGTFRGLLENVSADHYHLYLEVWNFESRIRQGQCEVDVVAGERAEAVVSLIPSLYSYRFQMFDAPGDVNGGIMFEGNYYPASVYCYGPGKAATYDLEVSVSLPLQFDGGLFEIADRAGNIYATLVLFNWFDNRESGSQLFYTWPNSGSLAISTITSIPIVPTVTLVSAGDGSDFTVSLGIQDYWQSLFPNATLADPVAWVVFTVIDCNNSAYTLRAPVGLGFPVTGHLPKPQKAQMGYELASGSQFKCDPHQWAVSNDDQFVIEDGEGYWAINSGWFIRLNGVNLPAGTTLAQAVQSAPIGYSEIELGAGEYGGYDTIIITPEKSFRITGQGAEKTWVSNFDENDPHVFYASAFGGPYPHDGSLQKPDPAAAKTTVQKGGGWLLYLSNLSVVNYGPKINEWYSDAAIFGEGGIYVVAMNCGIVSTNKGLSLNYASGEMNHCDVFGNGLGDGISFTYGDSFFVVNSIFAHVVNVGGGMYHDCCLFNCRVVPLGENLIFSDPMFAGFYSLQPSSPCRDKARDGLNIGVDDRFVQ
jgi:hypothetical protein